MPSPASGAFAGGHTGGVTPVPIPNTAVKTAGPMILLPRESRSLPAFSTRTPVLHWTGVLLFLCQFRFVHNHLRVFRAGLCQHGRSEAPNSCLRHEPGRHAPVLKNRTYTAP